MKKYLNFINESWYQNTVLNEKTLKNLLETDYSDFNPNDKPILRSINSNERMLLVKNNSERKSAYIKSNYYTLLLNYLPSWKDYPKRQFICSDVGAYFGDTMYRVIPKNGAKIGVCPGNDLQNHFEEPLGKELINDGFSGLSDINHFLSDLNIDDTDWNSFLKSLKERHQFFLDNGDDDGDDIDLKIKYTDIKELDRIINPNVLGFKLYDYIDYAKQHIDLDDSGHEVWLDSDIILVSPNYFD